MLKRLIERFFKRKCCKSFKNFRQGVINTFLRWLSLTKIFSKLPRFSIRSDTTPKLLTDCIKQEQKNFGEKGFIKSFIKKYKTKISYFYMPSIELSVTIIVLVFLIWFIVRCIGTLLDIELPSWDTVGIHAGIGVVIFALVIFVAESLLDNEAKDKARVLLKVSYLFPLVVAEIIVFLIFFWEDNGIGEVVLVNVIGLFTIYSLARIINVLLSKHELAKQRIKLLQERLQQGIDIALYELLGNEILSSKLRDSNSNIKICFSPYLDFNYYAEHRRLIDYSKAHYFSTKKTGIIADINFNELTKVSNLMG